MHRILGRTALIALVLATVTATTHAAAINEWNLIVRHNLSTTSEVDGSALIGGNVSGTSNYSVHGVTASNGAGLAVGGNISAGMNVQINNGGDLRIGGTNFGTLNLNGGGSAIVDNGISGLVSSIFSQANTLSNTLKNLTPNGTMDGAGNFNASPTLLGGQQVAIYNIHQNDFQSLGQMNLNFGSANTVIINVAADANGVVDFIAPPNIIGGFNQANSNRILWNLYNATLVKVNNSFNGALIAPNADLKLSGGGINGTVLVDNVSQMDAEVRFNLYTGYVPEPATLGLMLAGAGAMIIRRRR